MHNLIILQNRSPFGNCKQGRAIQPNPHDPYAIVPITEGTSAADLRDSPSIYPGQVPQGEKNDAQLTKGHPLLVNSITNNVVIIKVNLNPSELTTAGPWHDITMSPSCLMPQNYTKVMIRVGLTRLFKFEVTYFC